MAATMVGSWWDSGLVNEGEIGEFTPLHEIRKRGGKVVNLLPNDPFEMVTKIIHHSQTKINSLI